MRFGFEVHSQRGSHAKLRRVSDELDVGTLHAVFRQASRYIPADELRPYFFAE